MPCSNPIPNLYGGETKTVNIFRNANVNVFLTENNRTIIKTQETEFANKFNQGNWFEISTDKDFSNKENIIKIDNSAMNDAFFSDVLGLTNANNYYVRSVIKLFTKTIYSKPTLYQGSK